MGMVRFTRRTGRSRSPAILTTPNNSKRVDNSVGISANDASINRPHLSADTDN
jgi:hypothetical protein